MFAATPLLKIYIFVHCSLVLANAECTLKFPEDRWSIPLYEKSFGTRKVKVPFLNGQVQLEEGQNLTGTCATHFDKFSYMYHYIHEWMYYRERKSEEKFEPRVVSDPIRKISLVCVNGELRYEGYNLITPILSCAHLNWKIFESETQFPWCEPTSESYILGTKSLARDVKLAAACFDLETFSCRNVRYFAGPIISVGNYSDLFAQCPNELNGKALNMEIKYFDNTFSDLRKSAIMNQNPPNRHKNLWLKFLASTYEQELIVQGGAYAAFLGEFRHFLETYWWSSLRLGSWKHFQVALDKQASSRVYNLYAGTSGVVSIPFVGKCAHEDIHQLRLGSLNKTVPAYIWTYVEAVDGTENFVVVAYNSPFFEFFPEENTIFCKDICNEIEWLNDIRVTFRSAALGIIFCCNPSEVREHGYLDGFPSQMNPAEEADISITSPAETSMETTTFSDLSGESVENIISKRETDTKNQNNVRVKRKIGRRNLEKQMKRRMKTMTKNNKMVKKGAS